MQLHMTGTSADITYIVWKVGDYPLSIKGTACIKTSVHKLTCDLAKGSVGAYDDDNGSQIMESTGSGVLLIECGDMRRAHRDREWLLRPSNNMYSCVTK